MDKINLKKITAVIIGFIMILLTSVCSRYYMEAEYEIYPLEASRLEACGIGCADKLIIVAHPDDEILWAGGHMYDKGYFVVVVTNGKNEVRSSEFWDVIKNSGNNGIILDYPDKTFGMRDDWTAVKDRIKADLSTVMHYKSWKLIATHNEIGEYKHIHHVMTDQMVTDIFNEDMRSTPTSLYYFGKYYKKADLPKHEADMTKMSDERITYKEKLLEIYESQSETIGKLCHMDPYEEWKLA